MQKLIGILTKPFREHFIFLIAFFILATSPYILQQFINQKLLINGISVCLHCIVLSYLVTLLVSLIGNKTIRRIIQSLLMVIALVDFPLNTYCMLQYGYFFDVDALMLVLGTDPNEAKEFASTLIPLWIVGVISATLLILLILWRLSSRYNLNLGKKASIAALALTGLSFAGCYYTWPAWKDGPIRRWCEFFSFKYDDSGDLKAFYSHPSISFLDDNQLPTNVIVIVGESFSRSHSSLFGYEKLTNPRLEACRDSSCLFAFDSVDAPAPTTAKSIKYMLSFYSKADADNEDKSWYEYTSIIELMQECGFDCYWFSNQAMVNGNNAPARTYAEACKRQWFLQQEGSDKFNVNYDMILADSSYQFVKQLSPQQHNFIVYHMMGSHPDYKMRYPQEFNKFSEKDYPSNSEDQRPILATYDNSILYNDYVVNEIIRIFKDSESLVVYLPDHGQQIFRNPKAPGVSGHGNEKDPVSYALGVDIPFMVYASPAFQKKHPEMVKRLKYRQDNPKSWNSDDLPYFIMDLIGVKEINGEDIRPKSILN